MYDHDGLLSDNENDYDSDNEEQTFSAYYKPKPRASRYGDVDGYDSNEYNSDASSSCELCGEDFGHKLIIGLNNKRYCSDDCMDDDCIDDNDNNSDCSSNCSAHDVTEEEVINWLLEDGEPAPVRRSARIARRVQKFGPTSYVEMNSGVSKKIPEPVVEQKPVVEQVLRRSARIARRAQKFGPTSYVGMDSIEPEDEYDGITDIWYDNSVNYDSDYELPEEKKMREKEERRQKWIENFVARRQAKWAKEEAKQMKKELAKAKKANEQMDLDIQEQIAEDIAKLTLDPTKLSDEEYYQILKIKQNNNQELTWDELNFMVWHNDNVRDNIRDQKIAQATPWSIDNMVSQMDRIKAKLPPAVKQVVSIQQADKDREFIKQRAELIKNIINKTGNSSFESVAKYIAEYNNEK